MVATNKAAGAPTNINPNTPVIVIIVFNYFIPPAINISGTTQSNLIRMIHHFFYLYGSGIKFNKFKLIVKALIGIAGNTNIGGKISIIYVHTLAYVSLF